MVEAGGIGVSGGAPSTTAVRKTDLETLLDLLALEEIEEDVFLGKHPAQVGSRTFGGQLVAQGLIAAGRTVAGTSRDVHAING